MTTVKMDLSIIIPTFNERNNVRIIAEKITNLLQGSNCSFEIIFVDDSLDDTPVILEELCQKYKEVKYIHRHKEKGLASAVVKGFLHSQGNQIIVMDADLQHPPELLPLMIKRLGRYDVVIPSRFVAGGSDGGLNIVRKLISGVARGIGYVFIKKLRCISDSTSGYFGFKRSVIEQVQLNPIGWKILIEILVKGRYQTVHEIPYFFVARAAGTSKMNLNEQFNYLKHIGQLMMYHPEHRKFYYFCMIGTLGVFVNLSCLHFFLHFLGMEELIASIYASSIALLHNFMWNHKVTWKECKQQTLWRQMMQFPQFVLICSLGIAITTLFTQAFLFLGWNIYAGQLTGIAVSILWNFSANSKWTWSATYSQINADKEKLIVTQELPNKENCMQVEF
jgi:dolichol-phosphate mannosyltransferase